jgi:hypothetical protein
MIPIKISYSQKNLVKFTFAKEEIRLCISLHKWKDLEEELKKIAEEIYEYVKDCPFTIRGYLKKPESVQYSKNTIDNFFFYLCYNTNHYRHCRIGSKGFAKVVMKDNKLQVIILEDGN